VTLRAASQSVSSRTASGIQADLKTCEALEVFGTTAIVALTAQNTVGVHRVHSLPADLVRAQIDAVLGDMGAHAVKTGMLPSEEVIREVAAALDAHGVTVRVIDPVILAATGEVLVGPEAVAAIKRLLIPTATVLTPNMLEAGALLNRPAPADLAEMKAAAADLLDLGARSVLLKGGRLPPGAGMIDIYADGRHGIVELRYDRLSTPNTHGAGCTLAAAVAAKLAKQVHAGGPVEPLAAVRAARAYVAAVFDASSQMRVGTGARGPLNHARAPWMAPPGGAGRPVPLSRLFRDDAEVQQITDKCLSNGFLVGIADGSLPRSTFGGYVAQDKFFLDAFAQAYTLTLAKVEPHDSRSARDLAVRAADAPCRTHARDRLCARRCVLKVGARHLGSCWHPNHSRPDTQTPRVLPSKPEAPHFPSPCAGVGARRLGRAAAALRIRRPVERRRVQCDTHPRLP
jgi:hydroxymethylpyrimidine kinase/phosphomethylpyrimidine kinase